MSSASVITTVGEILREFSGLTLHYDPPPTAITTGTFCPTKSVGLDPCVARWLLEDCPDGLYRHQAVAIAHILAGENTVVATRTSSGKSLIYYAPVFNSICRNENSTALLIYPQKALANDQLVKLQSLISRLPTLSRKLHNAPCFVSRYDGATLSDLRPSVRAQAQIVLTNPDMLHVALLQYHANHWTRFFSNLQYVIIDECHEYRGIFGTNVAYVLRRLRQVCELNGSAPRFIATSATIRDPQEHLEKLTGVPFIPVGPESDGSTQGRKKFWVLNSTEHFYDFGRRIALELAKRGLSVLAFCPSRLAAERMMARVLSSKDDELPFVRVYRAGLSAEQREDIERGLRNKSVRLVFSTSALELGIDVGALDTVVCIGLPSSMMSLWQRAGRVARAGREGAIILVPADTPIDSYYATHPDELFSKENERLALNLHNRRVVYCHYACAVNEVGGVDDRLQLACLGEAMRSVYDLRAKGGLDEDVFYRSDPHMAVNIRSMGEGPYTLQSAGEKIGEIDEFHLLREAYRNAIYRHGGDSYRVKDVIKGKRLVILEKVFSWNETNAFVQKQVRLKRRHKIAEYGQLFVSTVDIDVTEYIVNVIEKDRSGKLVQQWQGGAGMPVHTLPTVGTLLGIRTDLWEDLACRLGADAKGALSSCERLFVSLFPTISGPCDIQDFSSFSDIGKDSIAVVYLYDMVYDGVDLTTGAFDKMDQLIAKAIDRVAACDCVVDSGCFRCIANPRIDEKASKSATKTLLFVLQEIIEKKQPRITEQSVSNPMICEIQVLCSVCEAMIAKGDRFCKNCGTKVG